EHRIENLERILEDPRTYGKQPGIAQPAEHSELHVMEQRAPGQWVEHLDRLRLLAWREPVDRLEEEPVRAGRVVLGGGRRGGTLGHLMACERGTRELVRIDETVGGLPTAQPAPPACTQCTSQMRIRLEQI